MGNCAWKLNTKYGAAYLENYKLVAEVLKLEGSRHKVNAAIMATYLSTHGKPFAWQVRFSMSNWEQVTQALGSKIREKKSSRSDEKPKTVSVKPKAVKRRAVSQPGRKKGT